MSDTTLIVRMTKNIFFKNKSYQIKVNGVEQNSLTTETNKIEFSLPQGKHIIEIGNKNAYKTMEVELRDGKYNTITVNPSLTYDLALGVFIAMAVIASIVSVLILGKTNLAMALIPFLPLFLFRKKQFADGFELTTKLKV